MKEQTQQEQAQPGQPPQEQILEFNIKLLPEKLTLTHWHCYKDAAEKYRAEERSAGRIPDELTAKFHGAVALIKAGYAVFEGLDEMKGIEVSDHVDLALIGLAIDYIAIPMETAVNFPLSGFSKRLSGTTLIVNGTRVPKD